MNSILRYIIIALILLAFLAFTMTYQVRFTEVAIRTSFGRADESSVRTEAGLGFKAPWPLQEVTKYDTRQRFVQLRKETQQTADDRQVIVEVFCTWRISDALTFFQRFNNSGERASSHYEKADEVIRANLRNAVGEISSFRMDELFTSTPGGSRIPDLEATIKRTLVAGADNGQSTERQYGIEIGQVGISRIILPESTTREVFKAMVENRNRLVTEVESQGKSQAEAITSKARADADRIRAFAELRADEIRAKGEIEATEFIRQMASNPELAVFLENIRFMKDLLARQTTIVVPYSTSGFGLFSPNALSNLKPGEIPAAFSEPTANAAEGQ